MGIFVDNLLKHQHEPQSPILVLVDIDQQCMGRSKHHRHTELFWSVFTSVNNVGEKARAFLRTGLTTTPAMFAMPRGYT